MHRSTFSPERTIEVEAPQSGNGVSPLWEDKGVTSEWRLVKN